MDTRIIPDTLRKQNSIMTSQLVSNGLVRFCNTFKIIVVLKEGLLNGKILISEIIETSTYSF